MADFVADTGSNVAPPRTRFVCAGLLIVVLGALAAKAIITQFTHPAEDFGYFYHAAEAMRRGEDIYSATGGHYVYPPLFAFLFQPLSLMSERNAALVWTLLSVTIVFATALLTSTEIAARCSRATARRDSSFASIIAAISVLLIINKLDASLVYGQTDSLIVLGFACAWRWMDRRPQLAGTSIAFAASIKYLSLIFLPYFLVKKNFRAVASSVVAFVLLMVLPVVQVGPRRFADLIFASLRGLARMGGLLPNTEPVKVLKITSPRSVSITSAVFRLIRAHHLPDFVAALIVLLIFVAFVATVILLCRRHALQIFTKGETNKRNRDPVTVLELAVIVVAALAFSPQTTTRHMVLLLLVYAVAVAVFLLQKDLVPKLLLAGSVALMTIGLSFPPLQSQLWSNISGPSWCALLLVLTIVWTGAPVFAEQNH